MQEVEWQPEHTLFGNRGSRVLIVMVGVRGREKGGGNHSLVGWSNGRTLKSESSAMIQSRKVKKKGERPRRARITVDRSCGLGLQR